MIHARVTFIHYQNGILQGQLQPDFEHGKHLKQPGSQYTCAEIAHPPHILQSQQTHLAAHSSVLLQSIGVRKRPLLLHTNTDTIEALHVGIMPLQTSANTKQFWDIEFTGPTSKSTFCASNPRIVDYINFSVHRQADGLYVVKFPWKPNHPYLPSNRGICEKRIKFLARKLSQTPEQLKTYGNIIAEQLTSRFIKRVAESGVPQHCHFSHIMQSRKSRLQPSSG